MNFDLSDEQKAFQLAARQVSEAVFLGYKKNSVIPTHNKPTPVRSSRVR